MDGRSGVPKQEARHCIAASPRGLPGIGKRRREVEAPIPLVGLIDRELAAPKIHAPLEGMLADHSTHVVHILEGILTPKDWQRAGLANTEIIGGRKYGKVLLVRSHV